MSLAKLKRLLPQAAKRFLYKCECKKLKHVYSGEGDLENSIELLENISPKPDGFSPLHIVKKAIGPDLSIIVPVYNAQNFLKRCIESCLSQRTEFTFEVIAVDDGSIDDSLALLRNYDCDQRLKVIHQENRGHAGARNAALDVASGRYICFVDSDDFIPSDAVQRLMSRAVELDADIVGGGYWLCDAEGRRHRFKGLCGAVYTTPTVGLSGLPCGAVYRRSLWDEVRFPEGFWFEDTCLPYLIFSRSIKTASISGSVYYYRANPKGITATFVGAPFKLTFGNVVRETLRLAKVERLPFVHDELAEGFAVEAGVPDLRVVLGRIQDLCSGLGLPRLPAVIVRSDDDMSEIGFYELYRVLIYPGLHEMPAVRMRDVRRKQRAVRQVGPDDWKPLLEAAAMVDGMIK